MNLNLSNYLTGRTADTGGKGETASGSNASEGAQKYHAANQIRSIMPGQTVSGEVVSVNGKEVQLAVGKDTVINARLEQGMNLAVGQTMTFEIKGNAGGLISLRPLLENTAQGENAMKALTAAGIPVSDKSIAMVNSLMESGMPIDRQSLQHIFKEIMANPGALPDSIVQMQRLQIPLTPENIQQFEHYQNLEHQVLTGIETVAGEIPGTFAALLAQDGEAEAFAFYGKILEMFTEEGLAKQQPETAVSGQNLPAEGAPALQPGVLPEVGEAARALAGQMAAEVLPQEQAAQTGGNPVSGSQDAGNEASVLKLLGSSACEELAVQMEKAGIPSEQVASVRNGTATLQEILQIVRNMMDSEPKSFAGNGQKLLSSPSFTKVLQSEVTRQWLLQPDEVAGKKTVEELYSRMREQTSRITQALSEFAKTDSPLMRSASNLSNNVEFIHQLNQVFTYVQLPLKMQDGSANGELYVFTNKKNLAKRDGNVSALLHLDMKYLGTMDIHVTLEQSRVSTKFYLEKEEYLDFIEGHLPELDKRLEEKGYITSTQALLREEQGNAVQTMLGQKKPGNIVAQYAFDVRA